MTERWPFEEQEAKDRVSRYEKEFGRMCLLHEIANVKHLGAIFASGQLLSTHEREARGSDIKGKSSEQDKKTGGAAHVFTRLAIERPDDTHFRPLQNGVYVILNSAPLDREDWYGYDKDRYGIVEKNVYKRSELFKTLSRSKKLYEENELMFPRSIDLKECVSLGVTYPRYSEAIEEWVNTRTASNVEKIKLLMGMLSLEDPNDEEALGKRLDILGISKEEKEKLLASLPARVVAVAAHAPVRVRYVRTWNDCIDVAHGREPMPHPTIEAQRIEIMKLLGELHRYGPTEISQKNYKSAVKIIETAANGMLSGPPDALRKRLAELGLIGLEEKTGNVKDHAA